ncbi:hypothetical protein M409DRAFT_66012 [Zasmidium cellare ATCC 36951]|uniref:Copper transport protein n=1 Tax=Zasmidium cellare ATCC 36951 TaxID=1080233 RepID=A0A6A6CPK7_ZASCE|nr:uncharacterized protein M409DRAFT_66012 [Zasmidium cellare ATCC 36951]KAF2167396.1 hypothetical protein M409DRAFT_66012 [Zasmidium cellare ATCC 36951]
MPMDEMLMVFFTSTQTALWSESWWPLTTGQYAGTCIFLIALAVIFRGLLGVRMHFDKIYSWMVYRHDTKVLRKYGFEKDQVKVPEGEVRAARWSVNEELFRAVLDTVIAGFSYLLMLAVMTMNVGYFMSVLGGVFLGSFVLGRYTGAAAAH